MQSKILKSTLLFSVFVLFAQIIGLVRDLYLVRYFGVGQILDTYYLAFKIPDLMNVFYSVFLGSVIFIPLLTKAKFHPPATQGGETGHKEMIRQVNIVGSMVLILVILVAGILFIIMPQLAQLLAPSWSGEQLNLLTSISRILLIAQLFFPIGILAGAIGMVEERPMGMAVSGAVYNLCILLGAIFLTPMFGIFGVVYGIIVGAICFALVQIAPNEVRNILKDFKFQFKILEWIQFVKQNLGRFFTVLLNQTFYIVILSIAAAAGTGSVTIFNNAFNVYMALFFVMGASFSTAMMPHNSKLHVEGKHDELKDGLHTSIIYMFALSLFFAIFCIVFSTNIIEILYYFSNLNASEISGMSNVFLLLAFSIPLLNLSEICRKYMYSSGLIKYSTINIFTFLLTLILVNKLLLSLRIDNLLALSSAIFLANILALFVTLVLLNYLARLNFIFILKNIYKPFLVFLLSLFTYIFTSQFLANFLLGVSHNYLFNLFFQVIYLFLIFIFFIFTFNDKITKDIFSRILHVII